MRGLRGISLGLSDALRGLRQRQRGGLGLSLCGRNASLCRSLFGGPALCRRCDCGLS